MVTGGSVCWLSWSHQSGDRHAGPGGASRLFSVLRGLSEARPTLLARRSACGDDRGGRSAQGHPAYRTKPNLHIISLWVEQGTGRLRSPEAGYTREFIQKRPTMASRSTTAISQWLTRLA